MQKNMIYLGRADFSTALASGASRTLTGGDDISQLEGVLITDVIFEVRTAITSSGSPTLHLATANGEDLTDTSADLTGDNAKDRNVYGPQNKTLAAADVAAAAKFTAGGTSSSYTAGEVDVYVEFITPRQS